MEEPLDVVGLERQLYPRDPDAIKDLVIFRRQYLQRINVKHITWPSAELLRIYDVQRWIYQWIASFMPTESNTKQEYNVLSELLRRIELAVKDAEEPDIYDPLFEICAEMCLHVHGPEAETVQRDDWVSYAMSSSPTTLADESIVKLIEKPRVLSAGGCSGYRTWQAALALASIISVHGLSSGLFRGRKILELGAGTGLLSFICASDEIGATVISTDGDETAVSRLQISASANGHSASDNSASFRSGQYLWGTPFEDTIIGDHLVKSSFDLVIASDVVSSPFKNVSGPPFDKSSPRIDIGLVDADIAADL